jgi:myo-inositol 2-dehydrogenase/D-chiro-inositol 1-dehydrogenase
MGHLPQRPAMMPQSAVSNRRDFLTRSGAVGATAAVAGTLVVPRSVHAGVDDTIKVALVGCGGRGSGAAAQALSTTGPVKLWAMADAFADRMQQSLAALSVLPAIQDRIDVPPQRQFIGLDAYRRAIDSGADVVILTAPPGFRPAHFEYAIQRGLHVFMEKPVATDAPGVRRLLAANGIARQKGLKVGVGLQRHHDPVYRDLVSQLQDGVVGRLTFYRCYWNTAAPAKTPPPREGFTELEYQVRNWYFFNWLSGDHIVEQHIHNLDVCNWIENAYPISAQGMGGRQVRTGKEYGNIYDHHFLEFTYRSGAKMFSQCRQIPGCLNEVNEYAHGTRGWADVGGGVIHPDGGDDIRLRTLGRVRAQGRVAGGATNPYQIEHDVLFDAIRTGKEHNETEIGAFSTLTAILGRMATYSGKLVTWDEALQSELLLTTDVTSWDAAAPVEPDENGYYAIPMPGVSKAV